MEDDKLVRLLRNHLNDVSRRMMFGDAGAMTATAQPAHTVSYKSIMDAIKDLPPTPRNPLLGPTMFGMPVYEVPERMQEIDRYETVREPGHPFVRWLAKFIPFDPDITIEVPVYKPVVYQFGNALLMSRETRRRSRW